MLHSNMLLTSSILKNKHDRILPKELFQPNPYGDIYMQTPADYDVLLTKSIQDKQQKWLPSFCLLGSYSTFC